MARDAVSKLCLLIMQATLKMPINGPAWRNVPNTTAQSDEVPHHPAPAVLLCFSYLYGCCLHAASLLLNMLASKFTSSSMIRLEINDWGIVGSSWRSSEVVTEICWV